MKPLPDIRRARFHELLAEIGGVNEVAARLDPKRDLKSRQVQVRQWAADPAKSGQARNIGHTSARGLESRFGKPRGWMDTDPDLLSAGDERVRNSLSNQSLATRLDAVTMSEAMAVLTAIEGVIGPLPSPDDAATLLALYTEIEAGGNPLKITAKYVNERPQGVTHGAKQSGSGSQP